MATIGSIPVLIGIFRNHRISIDRLFPGGIQPPTYGYMLTQAAYDILTPSQSLYYAIFASASGDSITDVDELTQAEYDAMGSHSASALYIITDGVDISDVYVGDTEAIRLYQGSTLLWESEGNIWRGSFTGGYRYTSSNLLSIGKTATSAYFMASDYYFPVKADTVYYYTATKSGISTLGVIINEYAANGSYIDTVGNQPDSGLTNDEIWWTTPSNCSYWAITYRDQHSIATLTPEMVTNVVLEKYHA